MAQTILPRVVSIVIVVIFTKTGSLQFVLVHTSVTFSVITPGVAVAAPADGVVAVPDGGTVAVDPGAVVAAAPVVAVGFVPWVGALATGVELEPVADARLPPVKSWTSSPSTTRNNRTMAMLCPRRSGPTGSRFPAMVAVEIPSGACPPGGGVTGGGYPPGGGGVTGG